MLNSKPPLDQPNSFKLSSELRYSSCVSLRIIKPLHVCFALKVCYWNCCEICRSIGNLKLSNHHSRTAAVQACGVLNIYRVEDQLHLATGKQPTSSPATYKLSPCRHHHHQAATIIYPCSLRRSGHPLSSWYQIPWFPRWAIHTSIS
jgi:hypothetical protein